MEIPKSNLFGERRELEGVKKKKGGSECLL